jgi:hypothetical protein
MSHLLSLFQIKTVRSAWVFLFGSGLMFLFGIYQAASFSVYSPSAESGFGAVFFSVWFVVIGAYMALASWGLWSANGRAFLIAQERIPVRGNRTVFWYLKFLFACYAAAFGTVFLCGVLSLAFIGTAGLEAMFKPEGGFYLLAAGLAWSPLVFRYLK